MNEKYAVLRTHVQRYIYIYIFDRLVTGKKRGNEIYREGTSRGDENVNT